MTTFMIKKIEIFTIIIFFKKKFNLTTQHIMADFEAFKTNSFKLLKTRVHKILSTHNFLKADVPQLSSYRKRKLAPTSFETNIQLKFILVLLLKVFKACKITFDFEDDEFEFTCTVFISGELVEFKICIFKSKTRHVLEFSREFGSKEAFNDAISLFSSKMKVSCIGSSKEIHNSQPPTLTNLYSIHKLLDGKYQLANQLVDELKATTTFLVNCSLNTVKHRFVIDLAFRIVELIQRYKIYNINLWVRLIRIQCMSCIAILSGMFLKTMSETFETRDKIIEWFNKSVGIVVDRFKDEDPHVCREARCATPNFMSAAKHITLHQTSCPQQNTARCIEPHVRRETLRAAMNLIKKR